MKAVWIKEFGAVANLEVREVDDPAQPVGDQVLVQIKAAGLNRADLAQLMGRYPAPAGYPQEIPGMEFAGEVVAIGDLVTKFAIGDRVFGIIAGGAQAEVLLTRESVLVKVPENLSFTDAAGVPEVLMTAHDAIFTQADLKQGETLLIHAVGSGVGLAALQLAKVAGAVTIGTSRTADKLEACKEFGLDHAVLTNGSVDLAEAVSAATGGEGVNVVLDLVGAVNFEANLKSLALKGRIMLVGLTGGATAEFNLGQALYKRAKIIGTSLRGRSDKEKAGVTEAFVRDVIPLLESGKVRPNIDKVFELADVRKAYEYLESNASFGKVVLKVQD
jgi:putative PIG3 family NAD(P)H quinone oxidoreductase